MKTTYHHLCDSCNEGEFAFDCDYHDCQQFYQWVCDYCGTQMGIRFSDDGMTISQIPTGRRCERTLALLRCRDNHQFMFIYQGCAWDGDLSNNKYHYEEHTCPTNLLSCIEMIAVGQPDPHGVFELVEEHLITGPNGKDYDEVLKLLTDKAVQLTIVPDNTDAHDPTPWCSSCGAMLRENCHCGPILPDD